MLLDLYKLLELYIRVQTLAVCAVSAAGGYCVPVSDRSVTFSNRDK
jgi:hypothetical protein